MNSSGIRIEDINHPDGGYAGVVFVGTTSVPPRDVMIRRFDTQQNYLSDNGWQSFEARIVPETIETGDGELYVTLGPQITQWIEYGERIEIELVDSGLQGVASWPEVASYTGAGNARGRRLMSSQAGLRQAFQPRQAVVAPSEPGAQPTVFAPQPVFPPPPPPMPRPEVVPTRPPPPQERKGRGWIHALALVLCLLFVLAAGGAAWQFTQCGEAICPDTLAMLGLGPDVQQQVQTQTQTPQTQIPQAQTPQTQTPQTQTPQAQTPQTQTPQTQTPQTQTPQTQTPQTPPGVQASVQPACASPLDAACLAARAPEDIFRDAQALFAQGSLDAGLLMYETAGERGYAPALTAIAKLYDPATFQAGRPFSRPNPARAIQLFSRAIAAGDTSAQAPRQALLDRLRSQADSGGQGAAEARRILEEFARNQGR